MRSCSRASRPCAAPCNEIDRGQDPPAEKFDELDESANAELSQKVTMLKAINNATRAIVSVSDTQQVLEQTMTAHRRGIRLRSRNDHARGRERGDSWSTGTASASLRRHGQDAGLPDSPHAGPEPHDPRPEEATSPCACGTSGRPGLNPTNRILADFRPSSFIVCPLIAEDKTIGILGADRRGEQKRVDRG